ncbi:hypothetical protein [Streptomyces sp. CA-251247]|uniref:hypothetical protein n=1 Tax=Streptomyces sp. CA-251247 TaxID=3240062 RepID=UPI003D89C9E0
MNDQPKEITAVWARTRDLSRKLDETNQRLDTLEGQRLADTVEELSLVVSKLADKPEATRFAVWNWAVMNPQQQAQAWEILLDWMEKTFRVRWPRSYREMLGYAEAPTSCWYRHPDMVETLTGLMASHYWAFTDPESGPLRVAEWLDRWLPGAVRQGQFILKECGGGYGETKHKDPWENKNLQVDLDAVRSHIHLLRSGELPD